MREQMYPSYTMFKTVETDGCISSNWSFWDSFANLSSPVMILKEVKSIQLCQTICNHWQKAIQHQSEGVFSVFDKKYFF